ncbi:MAG: hypothetical protein AAGN15_15695 [Cyanobacteria bacterium J06581_3]
MLKKISFVDNFDEWYEAFLEASPLAKYEAVRDLVAEPIPFELAVDFELGDILLDVLGLLEANNQVKAIIELTESLKRHQPDLFEKEFHYLDSMNTELAALSEVQGNPFEQMPTLDLEEWLALYGRYPVESVDMLRSVLDTLCCYDLRSHALTLCKAAYEPIKNAPSLIGNAETECAVLFSVDLLERFYHQLKQGERVSWKDWQTQVKTYDMEVPDAHIQKIASGLSGEPLSAPNAEEAVTRKKSAKKQRTATKDTWHDFLLQLSYRFYVHMAEHHQLSFVCSQSIWRPIIVMFMEGELHPGICKDAATFFSLADARLDRLLTEARDAFFELNRYPEAIALWGLPHFYDMLKSIGIIETPLHKVAMETIERRQAVFLDAFGEYRWVLSFVHGWGKPFGISAEAFETQKEAFVRSLASSTPLSETPGDPTDFAPVLEELKEALFLLDDEDTDVFSDLFEEEPAISTPSPVGGAKQKKKKSPLQEAKALSSPKKKTKKKKGKGFGS